MLINTQKYAYFADSNTEDEDKKEVPLAKGENAYGFGVSAGLVGGAAAGVAGKALYDKNKKKKTSTGSSSTPKPGARDIGSNMPKMSTVSTPAATTKPVTAEPKETTPAPQNKKQNLREKVERAVNSPTGKAVGNVGKAVGNVGKAVGKGAVNAGKAVGNRVGKAIGDELELRGEAKREARKIRLVKKNLNKAAARDAKVESLNKGLQNALRKEIRKII